MDEKTCSYERCNHPVYRNARFEGTEKCIFHCKHKDQQEFRNALARQIRKWKQNKASVWDFRGWVFVDTKRSRNRGNNWQKFNLFAKAVFPAFADFSYAEFHMDASFQNAIFKGDVSFQNAQFFCHAYFHGATFKSSKSELRLFGTCFAIKGEFVDVKIAGRLRLFWPGDGYGPGWFLKDVKRADLLLKNLKFVGKGANKAILDLRNNTLREDCKLVIEKCNMNRILLEGTDCRRIQFNAVEWPKPWQTQRRVVGDEWFRRWRRDFGESVAKQIRIITRGKYRLLKRLKANFPWYRLSITYQQLACRFRTDFGHVEANDFDRGVFATKRLEAMRRGGIWGFSSRLQVGAYALASWWGGSILLPIAWIIAVTAFCACFYERWVYDGFVNCKSFIFPEKGIIAALRVVGLNRSWLIGEADASAHPLPITLTATFQLIITAILVTLLVFSVRRRFRHG